MFQSEKLAKSNSRFSFARLKSAHFVGYSDTARDLEFHITRKFIDLFWQLLFSSRITNSNLTHEFHYKEAVKRASRCVSLLTQLSIPTRKSSAWPKIVITIPSWGHQKCSLKSFYIKLQSLFYCFLQPTRVQFQLLFKHHAALNVLQCLNNSFIFCHSLRRVCVASPIIISSAN